MFIPLKNNKKIKEKYIFKREIPSGLSVDVEKSQRVKRDSVLASGEVFVEKAKIDISATLGVAPSKASKHLEFLNGETVKKGEILARRRGKVMGGEETVVASHHGVVNLSEIESGFLRILGPAKESTVQAGVEGMIASVIKNRQVGILTKVLKVRPFALYGQRVQGELFYLNNDKIEVGANFSDGVMVLDFAADRNYLRELALVGVRGVIIGGIESILLSDINSKGLWGMTVCLLEGFGSIRMDEDFVSTLQDNDGYLCLMDSKEDELILTHVKGVRKGVKGKRTEFVGSVSVGDRVQIFCESAWGSSGDIEEISDGYAKIRIGESSNEQAVEVHVNNLVKMR